MKYNLKPDERATLELRGIYEKYGYKKYKMRKFEEYSLYLNNSGFLSEDKVLTFTDLDGRLLAMKPDVTLSVINNTGADREKTEKLYYIENVYRENKESHCFKEINQMGLEYLGNVDAYSVLEVMELAAASLKMIDEDSLLEISHMHYTPDFLESFGLVENDYAQMLENIRKKNITGIQDIACDAGIGDEDTELLCRIPFLYGRMDDTIKTARDMAVNDKMIKDIGELEHYCSALKSLGYENNVQLDLSMVNEIDYYNGIIFRGYIRKLPGCVLAGGQYDKAMELLGKKGGAVGFAIYLDELTKGKESYPEYDVDALLLYDEKEPAENILKAVKELQAEGLSVKAQKDIVNGVRYREKYRVQKGQIVKEEI